MKFKNLIISAWIAAGCVCQAGAAVDQVEERDFFLNGRSMYMSHNYLGAIQQLSMALTVDLDEDEEAQAVFYIAMSKLEQGDDSAIDALKGFIEEYPSNRLSQEAQMACGDYFFQREQYAEALAEYSLVRNDALSGDKEVDRVYRIAFSEMKLEKYDDARRRFASLAKSKRYGNATEFYLGFTDYAQQQYPAALQHFANVKPDTDLGRRARYYVAQINYAEGHYADVIGQGGNLLAENVENEYTAEIHRIVGESYYNTNDYDKATAHLNEYFSRCAQKNVKPMRTACYAAGVIARSNADNEGVIRNMSQVVGKDDALSQSAYLYLGQAYVKENNSQAAVMAFERSMKMTHDAGVRETAFFNYAVAQSRGSNTPFGSAIENFENFINEYPNSRYREQVEGYLVDAYISGNDYEKALRSINHISKPSAKVLEAKQYVLYNLGVNSMSNSLLGGADKYFTEALKLPDYGNGVRANATLWLGDCRYAESDFKSAAECYRQYVGVSDAGSYNHWLAYYNLGYTRFQQADYASARTDFEKTVGSASLLSDVLKADAYTRIGDTYYNTKQYSSAQTYYAKAISIDGKNGAYPMFQQGIMEGLQHQYAAKVKTMDRLISTYPNSTLLAEACYEKAQAQMSMNDNASAVATLEGLIRNYPNTPEARRGLLQLAMTLREQGKEADAIAKYKAVISKYPSSEEAQLALDDMKVIYAENGNTAELQRFLKQVPNAPTMNVDELDKLTFDAAEKAYLSKRADTSKLAQYVSVYPNGRYVANAKCYLAMEKYEKNDYTGALALLNEVLNRGTDSSVAERALSLKAEILTYQGRTEEALSVYSQLATKATVAEYRTAARLGMVRCNAELGKHSETIASANALLEIGGLDADEEQEAKYLRAMANISLGNGKAGEADLKALAADSRTLYGARSAYSLAEYYYNSGSIKNAEQTLNALIDSGTPQQYWLAKGFILLSDVFVKQGKKFEAKEYLQSLKNNYPGKEKDIFTAIETRLANLK